jgi:hypothetical protein
MINEGRIDVDLVIGDTAKMTGVDDKYIKLLGLCLVMMSIVHRELANHLVYQSGKIKIDDSMNDELVEMLRKTAGELKEPIKVKFNDDVFLAKYNTWVDARNIIAHSFPPIRAKVQNENYKKFRGSFVAFPRTGKFRRESLILKRDILEIFLRISVDILELLREKENK